MLVLQTIKAGSNQPGQEMCALTRISTVFILCQKMLKSHHTALSDC